MTRQLDKILERVRTVQPGAAEWSAIEARVTASMTSVSSAAAAASATKTSAVSSSVGATKGSVWATWVAGSVATGAVATGLVFAYHPGPAGLESQSAAPESLAPQLTEFPTRLNGNPLDGPTAESWPSSSVSPHRRSQRAAVPTSAPVNGSPPQPVIEATPVPETIATGESDVEHDRRHLAAVDSALRANDPRRALQLLSGFEPRKLHAYTQALRAIAFCNVGAQAKGAEIGRTVLPQVSNGGLERRVRHACKF